MLLGGAGGATGSAMALASGAMTSSGAASVGCSTPFVSATGACTGAGGAGGDGSGSPAAIGSTGAAVSAELEGVAVSGYGYAGGVVAAVLEATQAFNDDGDDGLGTDVTDDSTHGVSVDGDGGVWECVAVGLLCEVGQRFKV